jgi:short subunit fatty acids transporter
VNSELDTIMEVATSLFIVVIFVSFIFVCAWMYPTMTEVKKLDCSLAEFSPDISTEIKQLCREARTKK